MRPVACGPRWPRLPPCRGWGLGTGTWLRVPALAVGMEFPSLSFVYMSTVFLLLYRLTIELLRFFSFALNSNCEVLINGWEMLQQRTSVVVPQTLSTMCVLPETTNRGNGYRTRWISELQKKSCACMLVSSTYNLTPLVYVV